MPPVAKVTLVAVYLRIKNLLAGIKNLEPKSILADHSLVDDLGFTQSGVRALAKPLNKAFRDLNVNVTPSETGACDTVRDLAVLVFGKILNVS